MRCPRCDQELSGRPLTCGPCRGTWVSVTEIPRTVKSDPNAGITTGTSKISCPECYATMEAITLHGVHLDRCSKHGVWFDIGEITDLLRRTGKLGPQETAREDQESTASKVGQGVSNVGTAILEVLSTVVDIIT